jgi:hypothetical protein
MEIRSKGHELAEQMGEQKHKTSNVHVMHFYKGWNSRATSPTGLARLHALIAQPEAKVNASRQ